MDSVRDKLITDSAALLRVRDVEARFQALLGKIRTESLDKLKWYKHRDSKLLAIVLSHESRSEAAHDVLPELVLELKSALSEAPDDTAGHGHTSGDVDRT